MAAQMQLKILSFDDHDLFAAIISESALCMIGAEDAIKISSNEAQQTQQQEEKNNGNADAP
jgi:hypothetical protein